MAHPPVPPRVGETGSSNSDSASGAGTGPSTTLHPAPFPFCVADSRCFFSPTRAALQGTSIDFRCYFRRPSRSVTSNLLSRILPTAKARVQATFGVSSNSAQRHHGQSPRASNQIIMLTPFTEMTAKKPLLCTTWPRKTYLPKPMLSPAHLCLPAKCNYVG